MENEAVQTNVGQAEQIIEQPVERSEENKDNKNNEKKKEKDGKASTLRTLITIIVAVIAVAVMAFTIISVRTFDHTDRDLFGYRAFIVLSDSMSATDFGAGDLVLTKEVDPSTLQEGDIISFISTNESNYGEILTHKIRTKTTDSQGRPGFITYGTTTDTDDEGIVLYDYVLGKYEKHIPKVGQFFMFLKSIPGYFICIFLPFLILIIMQSKTTIDAFREYKEEQMGSIKQEQADLEAQKAELQQLIAQAQQEHVGVAAVAVETAATSVPNLEQQIASAAQDEEEELDFEVPVQVTMARISFEKFKIMCKMAEQRYPSSVDLSGLTVEGDKVVGPKDRLLHIMELAGVEPKK